MSFVSELDPKPLWKHFDEILAIPRPSTREEAMRRYVIGLAERKGLRHRQDATGNLVVEKPASPGLEGAPVVVLQGHLDMVTEKNEGVSHDFDRDPIVPRREEGWVKASGTTLGSDNGIGVAAILAVMEADDLVHGPLELLFTVDEETGLTGAVALDPQAIALHGRQLLNLDSEEENTVTIGCAGGAITRIVLPVEKAAVPPGATVLDLRLSGLKGGHSGMEIHLQRGSSVQLLARALYAAGPLHLGSFQGGNKQNALAREASARVVLPPGRREAFTAAIEKEIEAIRDEYRPVEPDLKFEIAASAGSESVWTEELGRKLLLLLNVLPHGVLAMSHDIEGLVETSVNLAAVAEGESGVGVLLSTRSSIGSALRAVRRRLRACAELVGAEVEENEGYPAWKPNLESPLLRRFQEVHRRVQGSEPELKALHAGLECGVLGEKFPGMDTISFGPIIEGAHSPDERVKVDSVGRFYKLLTETLAELAQT